MNLVLLLGLSLFLLPTPAPSSNCRPNQRPPLWAEHNGECLPSCRSARKPFCDADPNKCVGFSLASGPACSDHANYDINPVPSYQTCCVRKRKTMPSVPTPIVPAEPPPSPPPEEFVLVENSEELDFLGERLDQLNGKVDQLREELDIANEELQALFEIILEVQITLGPNTLPLPVSEEEPICPQDKREPDYRAVEGECLPSCQMARNIYCADTNCRRPATSLRQDYFCHETPDRYHITQLESYEDICCLIRIKFSWEYRP